MKYYTGVGSRKTPRHILEMMTHLATRLEAHGWTLRSGGAGGADMAFASGTANAEVYLPWNNFNGILSPLVGATVEAYNLAETLHPAWHNCSEGAKKLHARNVHQVLGKDMHPSTYSKFLVCWTPRGELIGGTATAIKLAHNNNIEVLNLAIKADYDRAEKFLI